LKKLKKTTIVSGAALILGAVLLSGCTANFCSNEDKACIAYPYDQGVTVYCDADYAGMATYKAAGQAWNPIAGNTNVWAYVPVSDAGAFSAVKSTYLASVLTSATSSGYSLPSQGYFKFIDQKVLDYSIDQALAAGFNGITDKAAIKASDLNPFTEPDYDGNGSENDEKINKNSILRSFGYSKFYEENPDSSNKNWNETWNRYDGWLAEARLSTDANLGLANSPTDEFYSFYKTKIESTFSAQRSCIATTAGAFGHYGQSGSWSVNITEKSWAYAWKKGLLSGLIVYPVAWMVDVFSSGLASNENVSLGVANILAIIFVTFIVRAVVVALTFKSTLDQQKTQALQPELAKLQAKYPNSNSNKAEQTRLAQEQMALYKRNKINPASIFIAMLVQFPVFIAVWGALQGSAVLSSGEVLGLRLSDTIRTVLFNTTGTWYLNTTGWWTALVLFILMSALQFLAMMLPQWMNKKRLKSQTKTGANPAQDKNTKTMKWVSYGMLIFTIIMGFSLPAAMGVYWAIGAVVSIIQSVITQAIMNKKLKKEKRL
jgi:YidC/Oxa1 family membrane protein insertase